MPTVQVDHFDRLVLVAVRKNKRNVRGSQRDPTTLGVCCGGRDLWWRTLGASLGGSSCLQTVPEIASDKR